MWCKDIRGRIINLDLTEWIGIDLVPQVDGYTDGMKVFAVVARSSSGERYALHKFTTGYNPTTPGMEILDPIIEALSLDRPYFDMSSLRDLAEDVAQTSEY